MELLEAHSICLGGANWRSFLNLNKDYDMEQMIKIFLEHKVQRLEDVVKSNKENMDKLEKASISLIKYFEHYGIPKRFQLDITGNLEWMLIMEHNQMSILFKDENNYETIIY